MSTELQTVKSNSNEDITLTRFWGGSNRKKCLQLTQWDNTQKDYHCIQMDKKEAIDLAMRLLAFAQDEVFEKTSK